MSVTERSITQLRRTALPMPERAQHAQNHLEAATRSTELKDGISVVIRMSEDC